MALFPESLTLGCDLFGSPTGATCRYDCDVECVPRSVVGGGVSRVPDMKTIATNCVSGWVSGDCYLAVAA